ncbi:MAG TPA: histidine phosphatase family protein [Chloroflexi bacterium]|nr:histidine phosphatase family protein [Chloroflexota bacterium]
MQLYLIRHGQSFVNLEDWDGDPPDAGLTDLGQKQATALAHWLPENLPQVDALYTSTMQRALETTRILTEAYSLEVREDDRLRELGNNRADHTPWPGGFAPRVDDYAADYWSSERPYARIIPAAEGSESFMHFRTRVGDFIEEVLQRHRDQIVVAVCHGGVIGVTFDHVFNVGPWRRCEIWTYNTGVTCIEYVDHPNREVWRLHYHNRIDHLHGQFTGDNLA